MMAFTYSTDCSTAFTGILQPSHQLLYSERCSSSTWYDHPKGDKYIAFWKPAGARVMQGLWAASRVEWEQHIRAE